MMRTTGLWIFALFVAACSGRDLEQSGNTLSSQSDSAVPDEADSAHRNGNGDGEQDGRVVQQITPSSDGGDVELDCVKGGDTGEIQVVFDCDMITVHTCKDLSNVVIEFEDGDRQRVMGVHGHVNAFSGNGHIIGVWVKSGDNGSGDGPGYGERFDAPEGDCDNPPDGGAGNGGNGGNGGSGGGGNGGSGGFCAPDDCLSGGSGGTGTGGDGPVPCLENPDDPSCRVD